MSRELILSNALETGRAIVQNDVTKRDLADTLLQVMISAIDDRYPVEIVWSDMARAMGYSDKSAKIEGLKMPGTLATYRSAHRKAIEICNGDLEELRILFSLGFADFKKMIYGKAKVEPEAVQSIEPEATEAESETIKLENVVIPSWLAVLMARHELIKSANPEQAAKFQADAVEFAKAWGA